MTADQNGAYRLPEGVAISREHDVVVLTLGSEPVRLSAEEAWALTARSATSQSRL